MEYPCCDLKIPVLQAASTCGELTDITNEPNSLSASSTQPCSEKTWDCCELASILSPMLEQGQWLTHSEDSSRSKPISSLLTSGLPDGTKSLGKPTHRVGTIAASALLTFALSLWIYKGRSAYSQAIVTPSDSAEKSSVNLLPTNFGSTFITGTGNQR